MNREGERYVLIDTIYLDDDGELHHRTDQGTNRRIVTRRAEQQLPLGSRIIGVILVNEGAHQRDTILLRAI